MLRVEAESRSQSTYPSPSPITPLIRSDQASKDGADASPVPSIWPAACDQEIYPC